jgi:GH18 family chitinase
MIRNGILLLKPYNYFLVLGLAIIISCDVSENEIVLEEPLIDIYEKDPSFKVVGYLPYYRFSLVDKINFDKVTYVNLAFGNLNEYGNLVVGNGDPILPIVQQIKSTNAKVLLSIAGGGDTGNYWEKYLSSINRKESIAKMVNFVIANKLDGIDVDIEGALIKSLGVDYNLFVQELKVQLHAKGLAITAALTSTYLDAVITNKTLNSFDFINIMAYDATGPWRPNDPGQHSSFSLAENALEFWNIQKGISREKLVLGVPFYGRDFDPSDFKALTYNFIINLNNEYAYSDEVGLLYYNGIPTIVEKTKLALQKANGVMIWELGQDAFNNLSLLKAIDQTVNSGGCEVSEIKTFYKDNDGDGLGDLMFPLQSCEAPVGYVNNKDDLDDSNPST